MRLQHFKKITYVAFVITLASSCGGESTGERQESVKADQYMVAGRELYTQYCSMCHQTDGEGLAKLYPPLNNSDFMKDHLEEVVCIVKNGRNDPIVVNGITYTQPMPAMSSLTNLEIAQVLTYIYNEWDNDHGLINVKEVEKYLRDCN